MLQLLLLLLSFSEFRTSILLYHVYNGLDRKYPKAAPETIETKSHKSHVPTTNINRYPPMADRRYDSVLEK